MRIRSITVGRDVVESVISFEPGEPLRTSDVPGASSRVLAMLPGLGGHTCLNGVGETLAAEIADTEFAHLLEHVALEVMALAGSPETLRGETVWDFRGDGPGVFRVRLGYDDDLVCLGAIATAERVVNWVVRDRDEPDLDAEVVRLRSVRSTGSP